MDSGNTDGITGLSWASLDLGADVGGGASISGGAFNDTSTHWFMPFNLSPPEVTVDDGTMGLTYVIGLAGDGLTGGLNLGGVSGTVDGKDGGGGGR